VWLYRGGDALFVMDYADNPPGAPAGSKLVRGFLDLQVGPESVVAVGQNDVGLMQTLRIIIADVEQRHAIGECIAPENLIHRQLADEVGVGTMFVMALDADDQVPDIIIFFVSENRRREFAV
jgi:hypothetical protein